MATKTEYVPRVNQIDAIYLNNDILRLIRDSLLDNLQSICPSIFVKIQPEVDLAIQTAIWLASVGKRYSTFGQQLLVLSYDNEQLNKSKLYLHFALTVLPNYIKSLDERRLRLVWVHRIIQLAENAVLLLSTLNFFRFLYTGRKPSLIDFFLNLDYVSFSHNQRRNIGYKYLTRELVWGGFMEMLGLILPIINFRKIFRIMKSILLESSLAIKPVKTEEKVNKKLIIKLEPNTMCVYCEERPTMPHFMPCGHIYCYYCIVENMDSDEDVICSYCGAQATKMQISSCT